MSAHSTLTIDLGVEELVFLLRTLRIQTIPGMGDSPTLGAEEEQVQRAMSSGFNSLRARGWVWIENRETGPTLVIDQVLVAYLGICGSAKRVLFLSRTPADGRLEICYIHFGDKLTVIHSRVQPGVHRFIGTIDVATVSRYISQMLHLDHQPAPSGQAVQIPLDIFEAVAAAVRDKRSAEATKILVDHNIPEENAKILVGVLGSLQANTMVAMLHIGQAEQASHSEGFSLMQTPTGFWMSSSIVRENEPSLVHIYPVSAEDCGAKLQALWQD